MIQRCRTSMKSMSNRRWAMPTCFRFAFSPWECCSISCQRILRLQSICGNWNWSAIYFVAKQRRESENRFDWVNQWGSGCTFRTHFLLLCSELLPPHNRRLPLPVRDVVDQETVVRQRQREREGERDMRERKRTKPHSPDPDAMRSYSSLLRIHRISYLCFHLVAVYLLLLHRDSRPNQTRVLSSWSVYEKFHRRNVFAAFGPLHVCCRESAMFT